MKIPSGKKYMKRAKSGYIIPKEIEEEWLREAADWKKTLEEYGVSKKQ